MDDLPQLREASAKCLSQRNALLEHTLENNPFYRKRLEGVATQLPFRSLEAFAQGVPLTTKADWIADQQAHPPYGTHLSFPLEAYTRCHQTSGTTGKPMRWLDTPASWDAMLQAWNRVYAAAGIESQDRAFFAFSFGPFLGFWTAFEAAQQRGMFSLSGGGMTTETRLRAMVDHGCTVLCCTPTYALRLAEVAAELGLAGKDFALRAIMVAGEPGGSLPAIVQQLQAFWPQAQIWDHHGMTEVGPVSYQCADYPCSLHVIQDAFHAEVLDPERLVPVAPGEEGELILTTLNRLGSPLIRYRTGDLVQAPRDQVCRCGQTDPRLDGGILGRCDDMVVVRGVNVYPSAIDQIVRSHPSILEYRVDVFTLQSLTELKVFIEPQVGVTQPEALAAKLARDFQVSLALRVPVEVVESGTLPRFEMKARRWHRL